MDKIRILYVGPDYQGSNGTCWRDAFISLGHIVRTINSELFIPPPDSLNERVYRKLLGRPAVSLVKKLNGAIIAAAREFRPQMTFYVKAAYVISATLAETRKYGFNFAYMNDDMFQARNQTFTFLDSINSIDCILTTKTYNVDEFHAAGAPLAIYIPNAYDPRIHYPAQPSTKERLYYQGDLAFIGTFRSERADFLAQVAKYDSEFILNVWGGNWAKMKRLVYLHKRKGWQKLRVRIRGGSLWCADMGKAIQSNKICLGLLYRANRDLHTSRSFEIPACGGFMLAERSVEHEAYFKENKEAAYFSSFEEMMEKIRYYLANESERTCIARAGFERCLKSDYRYVDRAAFAIKQLYRM